MSTLEFHTLLFIKIRGIEAMWLPRFALIHKMVEHDYVDDAVENDDISAKMANVHLVGSAMCIYI